MCDVGVCYAIGCAVTVSLMKFVYEYSRLLENWGDDASTALSTTGSDGFNQDNRDLLQLMEEAACVRNSNR